MNTVGWQQDAELGYLRRPAQGRPAGLLLLLHGVGANEQSLVPLALEQHPRIEVLLPRAPLRLGPDQYGWFPVHFGPAGPQIDPVQAESSRLQLIRWLEQLQPRFGVDNSQSLIGGFSQGGIMSASVALTRPDLLRGFAILSGRILPEIAPQVPADVGLHGLHGLVLHGHQDDKLPWRHAEQSQQRLQSLGVAHQLRGYPQGHQLGGQMRQDFADWTLCRLALR